MSWQIQIPYRDRSDPLSAVGELANTLEADEDCAAARQLVIHGVMAGLPTAGELVDRVEALDTSDRRLLLDAARALAGLESTGTVEGRRNFEAATTAAQITAAAESPWQTCPAEGCNAIPTNAAGTPAPVDVKRWWCPAHRDQAADGDMQPRPSRLRYSESGAIIEYDPVEEAREAAREERNRRLVEDRQAERAAAAEQADRDKQASHEAFLRELAPGVAP